MEGNEELKTDKSTIDTEQLLSKLQLQYLTLNATVKGVKSKVHIVLVLSITIAVINFIIAIVNALIGCGCVHADDCKCSNPYEVWNIISCTWASVVMVASIAIAFIEFFSHKKTNVPKVFRKNITHILVYITAFIAFIMVIIIYIVGILFIVSL